MIAPIFTGYDERESIGWYVFLESLRSTSKDYIVVPPLTGKLDENASNAFTHARFNIPDLCNWSGVALWLDGADMMLRADISELLALFDPSKAVQVVQHDYKPRSSTKYLGTPLECSNPCYPRKNWSSVILWNCGHISHFKAREEIRSAIEREDGKYLHRFSWLKDSEIGELPKEWNHLVGEYDYDPKAKLVHFTNGIPAFHAYRDCDYVDEWRDAFRRMKRGIQDEVLEVV